MTKGVLGDEEVRTHEYREHSHGGYSVKQQYRVGNTLRNLVHSELEKGLADHLDVGSIISEGDDDIYVNVHTGILDPKKLTTGGHYVFHLGDADPNEDYSVFDLHEETYDLDEFLEEYDLHGTLELEGRHDRSEALIDTENRWMDTNYRGLWKEARQAWKDGRVGSDNGTDAEYLTDTENIDFLAPLMFTLDAEEFESYNELASKIKVKVPELDADERGELVNRSKPGA